MASNKAYGRQTNQEKLRMTIQDDENTMMYTPLDYTGLKYLGTVSKIPNLQNMLFQEQN